MSASWYTVLDLWLSTFNVVNRYTSYFYHCNWEKLTFHVVWPLFNLLTSNVEYWQSTIATVERKENRIQSRIKTKAMSMVWVGSCRFRGIQCTVYIYEIYYPTRQIALFVRANFVDIYLQGRRDRSMRSGTELAREILLTDWSTAGNLSNRSSGVKYRVILVLVLSVICTLRSAVG